MSTWQDLLYEKRGGVATITFNRPERRNAITPRMFVTLADAWLDFRDDPECHVAILTGAGTGAFCAGGDNELLVPLLTGSRSPSDEWEERFLAEQATLQETAFLNPFELYKPIIAAINGHAVSGGCELLHATDLRVVSREAKIGLFEIQHGIIPAGGSLVRLHQQIPYCRAMEMILLGAPLSAEEAQRIGLVNEVVEPDQVMVRAEAMARQLVEFSPVALRKAKEAMTRTQGVAQREAYDIQQECWQDLLREAKAARDRA
jgi:enoyl-CoA hydratase